MALSATLVAARHFHTLEFQRGNTHFEALTVESGDALVSRLDRYLVALEGLAGLIEVNGSTDQAHIRKYVDSLRLETLLPGINGLGFIEYVAAEDREAFLRVARADGQPGLTIHPETGADELFVIKVIEPVENNREAVGLDIAFEIGRRTAAELARDTGSPQMTPRILLVQDKTRQPGFLLLLPHYQPGLPLDTVDDRRAAHLGWVYAPFVGARTLQNLTPTATKALDFWVFDGTESDPETLIYSSSDEPFDTVRARFSHTAKFDLFGRVWTVVWKSRPAFEASQRQDTAAAVLLLGLLITAFLAKLLHDLARRQETVENVVRAQTRDLQAQKAQNDSIINNPIVGILIADSDDRIIRANDAARRLLDIELDEETDLFHVLPELVDVEVGSKSRIEFAPEGRTRILSVKRNNWMTAEGKANSTFFLRDITQQEQDAALLIESRSRLDFALKASEIGVFEVDLTTGRSIVSEIWKKIMGVPYAGADFDAQNYFEKVIFADDLRLLKANDKACILGQAERSVTEFRVNLPSGTRWMKSEAFVSRRDETGRALSLVGTQSDITDSKEMDRIKNEFIATVSHELRTPLTSVKGAIGLLENATRGGLPPAAERLIAIASTNVNRLTELVDDILDLEKVQTGNLTFHFADTEVHSVLAAAREQILPISRSMSVEIALSGLNFDEVVSTDRDRLLQVLLNLLSNACKFAPAGSTVTLGAEHDRMGLRLFVRDRGPGVPESFLPSLFRPFSRADNSDTREIGGTGLGLSIAREIVERLGGQIGYVRTADDQTEFWIRLGDTAAPLIRKVV